MKSKSLSRDYPLSETKMSSDENKKTSSDTKSNVVKKISAAEARLIEKIKNTKINLLPASSNISSR